MDANLVNALTAYLTQLAPEMILGVMIRAIGYPDDLQKWDWKLKVMAKAYRRGTLPRSDAHMYYYYHWPRSNADFNVILSTDEGTVRVVYEIKARTLESGLTTVSDIEQSLASARLVK